MYLHLLLSILMTLANPAFAARTPKPAHVRSVEDEAKLFRAELVKPGETTIDQMKKLLGRPRSVVKEGASREYYFYDMGIGASMNATVVTRKGVVEYLTYLCRDTLKDVRKRYPGEKLREKKMSRRDGAFSGKLAQVVIENEGRGFVFDSRTQKVKVCLSWAPGRKFEDLGNK